MRVPGIPFVQGRNDYTDYDGKKYGIAIHNTSNDASDSGEANYATRRTDGISSHFYVDADSVTQSIDTDDRVGHAGSNTGNENAIAVEITGGNGKSRQWWIDNVAWDKLASVLAYVIKNDPDFEGFQVRRASVSEMKSSPRVKAFYGHNDMRLAWGGTLHTDPGENFPWDHFLAKVKQAIGQPTVPGGVETMFCKYGDKDENVKAMQYMLIAAGTSLVADGDYGDKTVEAVKATCGGDGRLYVGIHYSRLHVAVAKKFAGKDGAPGQPGTITFPSNFIFTGSVKPTE